MAMLSLSWSQCLTRTPSTITPCTVAGGHNQHRHRQAFSVSVRAQGQGQSRNVSRVWRRRKLKRKDPRFWDLERIPFLEEQMISQHMDRGLAVVHDIDRMLLSEGKYDLCNQIIDEAKDLLEKNEEVYGHKKPVHHAMTNRMNETGYRRRSEAYVPPNPFKITYSIRDQPKFL